MREHHEPSIDDILFGEHHESTAQLPDMSVHARWTFDFNRHNRAGTHHIEGFLVERRRIEGWGGQGTSTYPVTKPLKTPVAGTIREVASFDVCQTTESNGSDADRSFFVIAKLRDDQPESRVLLTHLDQETIDSVLLKLMRPRLPQK